jgi:hypothetical protein
MRLLITIAFLVATSAITVRAQVLVNRGAIIHVKEGALVHVNGDTENREGEIRVYDAATVTFNGNVRINFGGIYLLRNSFATVTRDLTIGYDGTCWRYDPGVLDVYGTIFNDGDLNNDGEINIGRP